MHAGVIRSKFKTTDLDKAIKEYRETAIPALATHKGARSAMLLVNRDTGDAISIGMYEDEGAARSFAPKAEKRAESLKKYQSESTPKRELYEGAASTQIEATAEVERNLRAFNSHDLDAVARDAAPESELPSPGDITLTVPHPANDCHHNCG